MRIRCSLAVTVLILGITGCSTFPQDFQRLAAAPKKSPDALSIEGPWQGEWRSNSGHNGQLRCLLARQSASPDSYHARFEAKFWGIFTAHYDTALRVKAGGSDPLTTHLAGDHDLGWLAGGVYHYEATVTPTQFDATYKSKADQGVFHMRRP
jgi:hypothetical protein